jgi:Rho termination factor-like protein
LFRDFATCPSGYRVVMAKNHGSQVKDDKQYEALRDKGMSKNKAARIANADSQGSGDSNPASKRGGRSSKYEDKTKKELQQQAAKVGIEGRSKMDKGELIDALRNH